MFVVMKIQDFDFESLNFPLPVTVDKGKMIGFLPVYATEEDALAEFPDAKLVAVQEVKKVAV